MFTKGFQKQAAVPLPSKVIGMRSGIRPSALKSAAGTIKPGLPTPPVTKAVSAAPKPNLSVSGPTTYPAGRR